MADKDLDTPILSDEEMDRIGSMSRAMVVRGICYSHNGGLDILATECEHCRKEERDFDLFEAEKRRRRAVYARSIATAEQRALHRKADNAVPVRYKGKGFEDFNPLYLPPSSPYGKRYIIQSQVPTLTAGSRLQGP